MELQELVPVGSKTTMRIGGQARLFAQVQTQDDAEEAWEVAQERGLPLVVLGSGANTIFADGVIEAFVVRIGAQAMTVDGNRVTVQGGKNLAMMINELAMKDLDLSALTGIPGTIGGAVFGNAGQGFGGIWIGSFVRSVTVLVDGEWKTFSQDDCHFRYRESWFKDHPTPVIIWEVTLEIPSRPEAEIKAEVERLLTQRIATQPHLKTAGSCFKSLPDGTPAWKLIEAAGLRGMQIGGVQIAEKHANFLLNTGNATFEDAITITRLIRETVPEIAGIEMRFLGRDGRIV